MDDAKIKEILTYLHKHRGGGFSFNRLPMVKRRITKRLKPTKSKNFAEYLDYLAANRDELDKLVDVLTIKVSKFFRNPLLWEYLAGILLPAFFPKSDNSIRVWSAGCASGEEPYSLAILLNELSLDEAEKLDPFIFATDIDKAALKKAEKAIFNFEDIKNIKAGFLQKYFRENSGKYRLDPKIGKMVDFSFFDLLDKKKISPPQSVFGNFDIILCRNVLIYFNTEAQEKIFEKLYRSLATGGYLILGKAETPLIKYTNRLKRIETWEKIYQKR